MIGYRRSGALPDKPHTVHRDAGGALLYEHCHTRDGFDGPFSILYHRQPPQFVGDGEVITPLFPGRSDGAPASDSPVRRRHLDSLRAPPQGGPVTGRVPLLWNADLTIGVVRPTTEDDFLYMPGDGDELFFIQSGGGVLASTFGTLSFSAGDYVFIPRGVPYHISLMADGAGAASQHWLWFELRTGLKLPTQYRNPVGQLRMDAPYTARDFTASELGAPRGDVAELRTVVTKRADRFTRHSQRAPVLDVVGWDGYVYPFTFPIARFSPKIGQVHLPPTVHGTFATRGSLVCSFVPRKVDFHKDAIPCPYPHSNVDVDEVIFYCDGDFTSRRGVHAGSFSLHPAGIPHGPHPGAYERSIGATETGETAVMVDTFDPLRLTTDALALDVPHYDDSWT
ncbi:MAG: homogentisate 1,2-dioxygenase [Myxococcales bacterium]|nr:homogentisate 1,2-dioxygenase [Myxococcales bacterium]